MTLQGGTSGGGSTSGIYLVFEKDNWAYNEANVFKQQEDKNKYLLSITLPANAGNFRLHHGSGNAGSKWENNATDYQLSITEGGIIYVVHKDDTGSSNGHAMNFSNNSTAQSVTFLLYEDYNENGNKCSKLEVIKVDPLYNKTMPDAMYLYGNIKKGSWESTNWAKLEKVSDGVYKCKNVEIAGRWNDYDHAFGVNGDGSERKPWGNTVGLNYVAFYDAIQTKANFAKTEGGCYKFAAVYDNDNFDIDNDVYVNYKLPESAYGKSVPILYQKEYQKNNFVVKNGVYSVTVDLNEGTVTFGQAEDLDQEEIESEHTYRWHVGDSQHYSDDIDAATELDFTEDDNETAINGVRHYTHEFNITDKDVNVLQVGCNGGTMTPAARQVVYTVGYKGTAKSNAKRRAGVEMPEGYDTQLTPSYRKIESIPGSELKKYSDQLYSDPDYKYPTTNAGDYTIIGSDAFNNNHLIVLNNVGEYLITAELKNDAQDVKDEGASSTTYYPATLAVTVVGETVNAYVTPNDTAENGETGGIDPAGDNSSIEFDDENDIKQAFNTSGTNELCTLSLDQNLEYDKDFTITIAPISGYNKSWALTTSTGEQLHKDYEDAFSTLEWDNAGKTETPKVFDQYKSIRNINGIVDGFYAEGQKINVTVGTPVYENEYYNYTVSANIPCSGIYTMVVKSTNSKYQINDLNDKETYYVVIYPNLYGKFGEDDVETLDKDERISGFSINGYAFDDNEDHTIGFPEVFTFTQHSRAFIPGTYFSSSLVIKAPAYEDGGNPMGARQKAPTNVDNNSNNVYYAPVDMRAYNRETSEKLTATVIKNGTTATYTYSPAKNGSPNVSTGVEAIGGEADGEAVYFNLQGVRVENPENGIFVKVQNGKAEKVVK